MIDLNKSDNFIDMQIQYANETTVTGTVSISEPAAVDTIFTVYAESVISYKTSGVIKAGSMSGEYELTLPFYGHI